MNFILLIVFSFIFRFFDNSLNNLIRINFKHLLHINRIRFNFFKIIFIIKIFLFIFLYFYYLIIKLLFYFIKFII